MRELEILKQKFRQNYGKRLYIGDYEIKLLNSIIEQTGLSQQANTDNRLNAEREFNDALLLVFIMQKWKMLDIAQKCKDKGWVMLPAVVEIIDELAFELKPLHAAVERFKDEITTLQAIAKVPKEKWILCNTAWEIATDLISKLRSGAGMRMLAKQIKAIKISCKDAEMPSGEIAGKRFLRIQSEEACKTEMENLLKSHYNRHYAENLK